MAIVRNNPLLKGMSGSIGKQITFRQLGGQTVISKYRGPSSVPPTYAQLSVRDRFAKAVAFARKAKKDVTLSPIYRAAASLGQSAYHLALRDALSVPVISQINCNNYTETITITARDIVEVHNVTVSIRNAEGILLEEGAATRNLGTDEWIYRKSSNQSVQKGAFVTALAQDYPGNYASLSVSLESIVSRCVNAATKMQSNKQDKILDRIKSFLRTVFSKYIEQKAREPDSKTNRPNYYYLGRLMWGICINIPDLPFSNG